MSVSCFSDAIMWTGAGWCQEFQLLVRTRAALFTVERRHHPDREALRQSPTSRSLSLQERKMRQVVVACA